MGFREGQWTIIERVLHGEDVLAILPTGGGKSVCYQVPALMTEGVTLVVSPLIALMQDQVQQLKQRGIDAVCINSTLSRRAIDQVWTDIEYGRYQLVYVSPERLQSEVFLARVKRLNIQLVAVDEAHCISEWGMNFRPSYLKIAELREQLEDTIPFIALTATATPPVQDDIITYLQLRGPYVYVKGFDRPNLRWAIFATSNKRSRVNDIIQGVQGSGIIYAATRNHVEDWADWLNDQGYPSTAYHGGMPASKREVEATAWLSGEKRIMVATNAFGMGIDKPDVRFVIHVDMPGGIEAYYQEAGRAGRDGQRGYAVLLYQEGDEETQERLIEDAHPGRDTLQQVYNAVCNLSQLAIGELPDAPILVPHLSVVKRTGYRLPVVKAAIEMLVRHGVWNYVPTKLQQAHVRFLQPTGVIRSFASTLRNAKLKAFIEVLLRTVHGDAFSDWWEVDLPQLERKGGIDRQAVFDGFDFLHSREFLEWFPPGSRERLFLNSPRARRLILEQGLDKKAKKRAQMRLKDMNRYIHSVTCRRQFLLKYFGEPAGASCGRCDICLGRHEAVVITSDDEPAIRALLRCVQDAHAMESLPETLGVTPRKIEGLLRWLLQEEYLEWAGGHLDVYTLTGKAERFLAEWNPSSQGDSF